MNRAAMRGLLQRQVQDVPGVMWSITELNDMLNLTYSLVQKEIYKVSPEAHLFWDNMNVTAGTSWYPLPETFGISSVGLKTSSSATIFTALKRKRYVDILELTGTDYSYARRGQWIGVFPTPTVSVTNGLEVVHTPIMAMSADTDVPRIKTPLHLTIVLWAKLLLLGETDEQTLETRNRISEALTDIPMWYDLHSDTPDQLQIDA